MAGADGRGWPGPGDFADTLAGARRGDEESFARIWRWLQPAVVGWLRVVAPGAEEDASAETWVSVTRSLGNFEGDSVAFRSWVFTIARRRALDAVRAAGRRPTVALDPASDPVEPEPDPSILVAEGSGNREALALLGRLPDSQRQVVALRVVAGLSVAETAAVMGKSEGAVRVLGHRGLRTLASLVGQRDEV